MLTPARRADNNYCGLDQPSDYNLATWDTWAKTKSANKNVKVYIGAPGSADSAGEGYVDVGTLADYVADAQAKYSSFGGVMLWDASTAHGAFSFLPLAGLPRRALPLSADRADIIDNARFDLGIKNAMTASALKLTPEQLPRSNTTTAAAPAKSTQARKSASGKPRAYSRAFRL